VADLNCDFRAHSPAFLLPIPKMHSASAQVSRLAPADTRAGPASLAASLDAPARWDASSVSAAPAESSDHPAAPVGSLVHPVSQAERSACRASAPVECLAFPASAPEMAMASASQFLAVFHQLAVYPHLVVSHPVDDTVVAFRAAVDANLPVVAAEAVAAGNRVGDSLAENLDSSRPTSTDSRNTASRRNKPSARSNSCASRNNPIRNSNC
jgi:hypothetical protein